MREALTDALRAIQEGFHGDDLFYVAGAIAYRLGEFEIAYRLITRLLQRDPDHISGWVLFGEIHRQQRDPIRAAHARQHAETLFPALREIDLSGFEKETVGYDNGSATASSNSESQVDFDTLTFGEICIQQGYFNKALKIFQDFLIKHPERADITEKIALLQKKLSKDD